MSPKDDRDQQHCWSLKGADWSRCGNSQLYTRPMAFNQVELGYSIYPFTVFDLIGRQSQGSKSQVMSSKASPANQAEDLENSTQNNIFFKSSTYCSGLYFICITTRLGIYGQIQPFYPFTFIFYFLFNRNIVIWAYELGQEQQSNPFQSSGRLGKLNPK